MSEKSVVTFKPDGVLKKYTGTGPDHRELLECKVAGEYECSPEKAAQVCADFPKNFSLKSGPKPTANRMAEGPSRDK